MSERGRDDTAAAGNVAPGPVMVIGGAEDKLRDKVILHRFIQLSGGTDARIVVIATASSLGDEATELYSTLFTSLGAAHVWGLRPMTREYANDRSMTEIVEQIGRASCRERV